MSESSLVLNVMLNAKVQKYGDEWSQEDIAAGIAVPYEVVESEVPAQMTAEQLTELGFDVEELLAMGAVPVSQDKEE